MNLKVLNYMIYVTILINDYLNIFRGKFSRVQHIIAQAAQDTQLSLKPQLLIYLFNNKSQIFMLGL